mgnify:CR=1 FL=1
MGTTTVYGVTPSKPIGNDPKVMKNKIKGMSWPFGSRLEKGFFPLESGVSLIKNNIKQLLQTERGERIMLPDYGTNLRKFLFQPVDKVTFDAIKEEVLSSISKYKKDVVVLGLRVEQDKHGRETDLSSIRIMLSLGIREDKDAIVEVQVTI